MLPPPVTYNDELLKVHLAQAAEALPGPDYYEVLRWIHEALRPATYVEIGIRSGASLRVALPETRCIGIDPLPMLTEAFPSNTQILAMTSDSFFVSHSFSQLWGVPAFQLAFIDGLHLFEQALRDFINLEQQATRRSIVMIHDCLPLDRETSQRVRSTHFYSGDIWKLAMCLKANRPELRMKTIATGPTGLCLVSNLDRKSAVLPNDYDHYVAQYVHLTFDDYQRRRHEMPEIVGNTPASVRSCLAALLQD